MIKEYGKCGKACEICMYLGLVCKGCLVENEKNPDLNCVIYDCAIKLKALPVFQVVSSRLN